MNSGILEAKKLDNIMKSPVIHHISSSMAGVVVIRGFGKEEVFKERFNTYLNKSMAADALFRLAQRWFMWRMDSLALLTITLTGVVTVATKGTVSVAVAGLAMAMIFQVLRRYVLISTEYFSGLHIFAVPHEDENRLPRSPQLPGENHRVR